MRLIDADTLLEAIDPMYKAKKDIVPDNFAEGCVQMEKLIKQQPTAYDVDKVIEELTDNAIEENNIDYDMEISLEDAIDIVKRGGVDE